MCLSVKCAATEQRLSAGTSQLPSHSGKVNDFPPCANFLSVSPPDTLKEFSIARSLAALQGQVDLMAFQSASICPAGGAVIMNARIVLLSFSSSSSSSRKDFACFAYSSHVPVSLPLPRLVSPQVARVAVRFLTVS